MMILVKIFFGIFPSDKMNKFISNTDRSRSEGTHWLGILDPHQKVKFFYLIRLVSLDWT